MPYQDLSKHQLLSPEDANLLVLVARGMRDTEMCLVLAIDYAALRSRMRRYRIRSGLHHRRLGAWAGRHYLCCLRGGATQAQVPDRLGGHFPKAGDESATFLKLVAEGADDAAICAKLSLSPNQLRNKRLAFVQATGLAGAALNAWAGRHLSCCLRIDAGPAAETASA
ncbi:MAG: hypothetical protein HYX53_16170 [Chloroflexi bacterium]|nr:hypothetical protein [Chloroflexota bacterium]